MKPSSVVAMRAVGPVLGAALGGRRLMRRFGETLGERVEFRLKGHGGCR